ncbi:hypothetical protein QYE76_002986 [Lolium multiflorum]|uniref:Uncharacterized protein n=1 Tax=Lolium multiflorum TaxID=4521 RepID=A0AAD8RMV7_LOLMU|nr:hypothetical protein QYE76_002986 [Lolium multiflorum]
MAATVGREFNGGGGGSRWAEEEWKETSVVYYPTATRGAATPSKETLDQLENDGVIRSRNYRDIEEENKQLVQKLNEMENEIKRRKSRKKEMQRAHQQDLRNRDRREFIMLTVVASCLILYCVVALFIRGFV